MKTLLFSMFSFLLLQVTGQNHFIGLKGGESWTGNAVSSYKYKYEYRSGHTGGITYEYRIDKHISLGADLTYDQRGFIFRDTTLNYSGNPNLKDQINKFDYRFDYISVPIKAGFNIGNSLYGFANLGLSPSFLIDATTHTKTFNLDGTFTGSETQKMFDRTQKFDLSGFIEAGGGYKFKHRYWLFASFSYQYSISTYYFITYGNEENRHKGTTLSLGLKYGLTTFNQKQPDSSHMIDGYYLKKSKSQKAKAKSILYTGLGLAALGGIVQLAHENSRNGSFEFDFTGAWMAVGGGCVSLFSVPFFISSGVNARKAATITLSEQQIITPQTNAIAMKPQPSIALNFKFK